MAACAGCGNAGRCGCCAGANRSTVAARRSAGLSGFSVWIADPELGERPICLCPSRRDAEAIAVALGQAYELRAEVRQ